MLSPTSRQPMEDTPQDPPNPVNSPASLPSQQRPHLEPLNIMTDHTPMAEAVAGEGLLKVDAGREQEVLLYAFHLSQGWIVYISSVLIRSSLNVMAMYLSSNS